VIGEDGADPDRIRVIDLSAGGAETGARTVRVDELLADPRGHFPGLGGRDA
jgi:hypothetical protein